MKYLILVVTALLLGILFGVGFILVTRKPAVPAAAEKMEPPEISGWVAWWKEEQAYDLVASQSGNIKTVSPVWWLVDENSELKDAGEMNRGTAVFRLKKAGVEIYPTIGSELTGNKLSPLLNDERKFELMTATLLKAISDLPIDGIDVDLEGISKSDRDAFSNFLEKLKSVLAARNLKMSVTIQAQDGKNLWFSADGQDVARIGQIADEVRIMAYDRHSESGESGPIAPQDWISDVAKYNLGKIDKSKIVMGIPSYGYIWPKKGSAEGLQWDEFYSYIKGKNTTGVRDEASQELYFSDREFTGWLSDAQAMESKIDKYRKLGLNRFIVWHLGGMDETLFAKLWQ